MKELFHCSQTLCNSTLSDSSFIVNERWLGYSSCCTLNLLKNVPFLTTTLIKKKFIFSNSRFIIISLFNGHHLICFDGLMVYIMFYFHFINLLHLYLNMGILTFHVRSFCLNSTLIVSLCTSYSNNIPGPSSFTV